MEQAFDWLDAPVARVAAVDVPLPYAANLEKLALPSPERIVEAADAAPAELALRRINAGLYALPAPEVFAYLDRLDDDNAQGELYLTDALGAAAADGRSIALHGLADPAEALGVNTREELAAVDRLLRRRDRDEED